MADSIENDFASFLAEIEVPDTKSAQEEGALNEKKRTDSTSEQPPGKRAKSLDSKEERKKRAATLRKRAFAGNMMGVRKLLEQLAPVDRLLIIDDLDDDDGHAPLHLAVMRGHSDVVGALLNGRADVDCLTLDQDTPLMWAANLGYQAVCRVLIRNGADPSIKNRRFKKAKDQAKAAGHLLVRDILENYEFDPSCGSRPRTDAQEAAAAARRRANAALVQEAITEAQDEEAFWSKVRSRREARDATVEQKQQEVHEEARIDPSLPSELRTHFKTLELNSSDVVEVEVRRAYRKLALKHHPDKNPGDPEGAKQRFEQVAVAYEAVCEHLAKDTSKKGCEIAPPRF